MLERTHPAPVVLLNDFGEDIDDPFAMPIAAAMQNSGMIDIRGVVTGTDPVDCRTNIGRMVLDNTLLRDIPLAAGRGRGDEFWFVKPPLGRPSEFGKAPDLLDYIYQTAAPKSVVTIIMAPCTDFWFYLGDSNRQDRAEMVIEKTSRFIIMGMVEMKDGSPVLDEDGFMTPDTSKNLQFNQRAGSFLVRWLQQNKVPTTFLSRFAAYATTIKLDDFRTLSGTNNPVGIWLADGIDQHFNEFWFNCNLPPGHPIRIERNMPERHNREFFIKFILRGKGADRKPTDKIHDLVEGIPIYDALAVLLASPEIEQMYFEPISFDIKGVEHKVIGLSPENSGVKVDNLASILLSHVSDILKQSVSIRRYLRQHTVYEYEPAGV